LRCARGVRHDSGVEMSGLTFLVSCSAALAVLAIGIAAVSLAIRRQPPEFSALTSQVRALDSDLSELADKVQHWMRRDAVRRARSGQDEPAAVPAIAMDRKAELRQRVAALAGRK
jgi:hypothetical protein